MRNDVDRKAPAKVPRVAERNDLRKRLLSFRRCAPCTKRLQNLAAVIKKIPALAIAIFIFSLFIFSPINGKDRDYYQPGYGHATAYRGNGYDKVENGYPEPRYYGQSEDHYPADHYYPPKNDDPWPSLHLIIWIILLAIVIWLLWCPKIQGPSADQLEGVVRAQFATLPPATPNAGAAQAAILAAIAALR
jgi:hypothetical protein